MKTFLILIALILASCDSHPPCDICGGSGTETLGTGTDSDTLP